MDGPAIRHALEANVVHGCGRALALLTAAMAVLTWSSGTADATTFELPEDGSLVIGTDTSITTHYKDTLLDIKFSIRAA